MTWEVEPMCDFNRESDGGVWADVDFGNGISIVIHSDDPVSPREWEIDDVRVAVGPNDIASFTAARHEPTTIEYDSQLGRGLAREWDRYIAMEQNLPYAAGAR